MVLHFPSEEGMRTIMGTIGVFTDPEACDTLVLGRDVLNNFRLIFDRGCNFIRLLSSPRLLGIG
jgi:hypothetical protein